MSVGQGLEVAGLAVEFGGLIALSGVSLEAPRGRLTGLIGPNGAGKTTLFNAATGWVTPSDGEIIFDGQDITKTPRAQRARLGLGRTFQRMELYDALSVAENVALGREAALAGARILGQVIAWRGEIDIVVAATREAIEVCGLERLVDQPAGGLSTGQRRLVELARALAGPFSMLLLDEPSAGLDRSETARFGAILKEVMATRDLGILLVEHDMDLVMSVCEQVFVLDFGKLIFQGTTSETRASEVVRAAYLGTGVA